jgi:hypothetical protein
VLAQLQAGFVEHAKQMAEALNRERLAQRLCLQALLIKNVEELEPCILDWSYWESCKGLTVLISPEMRAGVTARLADWDRPVQLRDFDAREENLASVISEILAAQPGDRSTEQNLSLVAPFYFLKRDGIRADAFPHGVCREGIKIFANNYALQGVKIKGCRRLLNKVYCLLAHLPSDVLQSCHFLAQQDGIHVADLSFIPEQYRLDTQRAEMILNGCLNRWLETIQAHVQGR